MLASVLAAVRRMIAGPPLSPEEALRRHGERLEAEAALRQQVERAVRHMPGRFNRFVR
jgi:hypothetical protein